MVRGNSFPLQLRGSNFTKFAGESRWEQVRNSSRNFKNRYFTEKPWLPPTELRESLFMTPCRVKLNEKGNKTVTIQQQEKVFQSAKIDIPARV